MVSSVGSDVVVVGSCGSVVSTSSAAGRDVASIGAVVVLGDDSGFDGSAHEDPTMASATIRAPPAPDDHVSRRVPVE